MRAISFTLDRGRQADPCENPPPPDPYSARAWAARTRLIVMGARSRGSAGVRVTGLPVRSWCTSTSRILCSAPLPDMSGHAHRALRGDDRRCGLSDTTAMVPVAGPRKSGHPCSDLQGPTDGRRDRGGRCRVPRDGYSFAHGFHRAAARDGNLPRRDFFAGACRLESSLSMKRCRWRTSIKGVSCGDLTSDLRRRSITSTASKRVWRMSMCPPATMTRRCRSRRQQSGAVA